MQSAPPPALIQKYFRAYESKDRAQLEALLCDDFTFTSPLDDGINRTEYFERCWPNSAHFRAFHFKNCAGDWREAFVTYECERTNGSRFRNTELFTFDNDRIKHVEVYFGRSSPVESGEDEIRALVDQTNAACRAKDAAALIKHYSPGVLAFDLIIPLQYNGADAVKNRAAQWFASFKGPISYDVSDLRIAAADGTAFCHGLSHVSGTTTDGERIDMWWRATFCWQKRDERWLITHSHHSVPFDMETGKASLSLRP